MKKQIKKYIPLAWTGVEIFLDPALYKDRGKLPFIKNYGKKNESFWSVKTTGDTDQDENLGRYYALLWLAHNDYQRHNTTRGLVLNLGVITSAMPKEGTRGYSGSLIEAGFFQELTSRLSVKGWGCDTTNGVFLEDFQVLRRGGKPYKNDPFAILERKAAKKKAADEKEARALAKALTTPKNLREISRALAKANDAAELMAVSRDIDRLQEPHKTRLRAKWTAIGSAMMFAVVNPKAAKKLGGDK